MRKSCRQLAEVGGNTHFLHSNDTIRNDCSDVRNSHESPYYLIKPVNKVIKIYYVLIIEKNDMNSKHLRIRIHSPRRIIIN